MPAISCSMRRSPAAADSPAAVSTKPCPRRLKSFTPKRVSKCSKRRVTVEG